MFKQGDSVDFYQEDDEQEKKFSLAKPTLLGKTFLWLFIALVITSVVAYAIPTYLIATEQIEYIDGFMLGGAIVVLITSFILRLISLLRGNDILCAILMVIYSIAMGCLLSFIPVYFETNVIVEALAVTAIVFGLLAVYGIFSKANHISLLVFVACLSIGCLILALVNLFMHSEGIYYLVSMGTLFCMLAYVILDANFAMRASKMGEAKTSTAIFFALNLYSDFIYIFLRILVVIAKNKK